MDDERLKNLLLQDKLLESDFDNVLKKISSPDHQ